MVKMKPSTIAVHIALFGYPVGADVAFVSHPKKARKPTVHHVHRPPRQHESRHPRIHDAVPSPLDTSVGSSASEIIEMLPVVRRRHPLFRETNAVSKPMPVPQPELWRQSLPAVEPPEENENEEFWSFLSPQKKHVHGGRVTLHDAHVQFRDPEDGARRLLAQCGVISGTSDESDESSPTSLPLPEVAMAETETTRHLTDVLSYFQSVAAPSQGPENVKCIARAVSTVGSIGTKCPRWHADHVQVRLIMSILGPGCEYIPQTFGQEDTPEIVNRGALNNLDEDDTAKANDIIVPPKLLSDAEERLEGGSLVRHAKAGEAVLLMGRGWEDPAAAPTGTVSPDRVLAAVHRSPVLSPGQERILLTVDLVDWE